MATNINRNLPGNAYDAAVLASNASGTNTFATQLDLANINNVGNANLLISGGASWSGTGMVFNVSSLVYQISGVEYSALAQSVTLPASNPTNPRFDAIVVNEAGIVSIISGTPAANPLTPAVDENYVLIQYVLIGAGAVAPTITNQFVYREGSSPDWTAALINSNPVPPTPGALPLISAIYNSTTPTPFQGTQCTLINAPSYTTARILQWTKPSGSILRSTFSFLSFRVQLLTANRDMIVRLYNGATMIGVAYASTYGLSISTTNAWQLVVIPVSAFGNPTITTITRVQFLFTGSVVGTTQIALDDIKFQSGYGPQANVATVDLTENGTPIGSTAKLNFVYGAGSNWSIINDPLNNRINIQSNVTNAFVQPELNVVGRTLIDADAGKFIMVDSVSPESMQVPRNNVIAIPIGTVVKISQQGTGVLSIGGMVGVALLSASGLIFPAQYVVATLTKTDTDTWYVEYSN